MLAGGGCKTFWSIGVLQALADELPPVRHYAGVSAGAAMALVEVSGRVDAALEHFLAATAANRRNIYPARALLGLAAFPHEAILRTAMRFVLDDGGFARIRAGAPVHILLSYVRAGQPGLRVGLRAYRAFERRSRAGQLHGPDEPPPGIREQIVRSADAMDGDQLIDWVVASSSTPPVTRVPRRAGRRYLDGALIDNIPLRALPADARRGPVLAVLANPTPVAEAPVALPEGGAVLYLAPSAELPARMWDYTSPKLLRQTYELGLRDGEALRKRVRALR